ncbi:hypothetical protein QA599_14950 [Haloarculaceae archaeon H-GB1-1]|nr:hypothetical protein [Haloarculaceae archaeon H-GB1-1]
MDRRRFLAAGSAALSLPVAGCRTAPSADASSTDHSATTATSDGAAKTTVATPSETTDNADNIRIVVNNGRSEALDVDLTVSSGDAVVFADSITVSAESSRSVDPGIDEQGGYELTVVVDGSEYRRPFDVEGYDLEMGSNLIVEIGTEIRIPMEE